MPTERLPDDARPQTAAPLRDTTILPHKVRLVLGLVGSPKVTLVLFCLAVFLIFAGTMAQARMDIWEAMNRYFRSLMVTIELQVFFPSQFFPSKPEVPGWFVFPGGWLIGGLLLVNLVASAVLRFPVAARGKRLWLGLGVMLLGLLAVWAVVASGTSKEGLHYSHWLDWSRVWQYFLGGLALVWVGCLAATLVPLVRGRPKRPAVLGLLIAALAGQVVLGGVLGWLAYQGDEVRLNDSNMRILWQLMKATAAAIVLLVGCSMLFKRKGALVTVHVGIVLMMLGELYVGLSAVEAYMTIAEGETVDFVEHRRRSELAVIDTSDPRKDKVVVVPESMLQPEAVISHEYLPFDFEVVQYLPDSVLRDVSPTNADDNPATAGIGRREAVVAEAAPESTGTDSRIDVPSAYVRIRHKGSDRPPDVYLFSRYLAVPERIAVAGKAYDVFLRAKRTYKSYSLRLLDARKDDYVGTDTPRNYSSDVYLSDPGRGVQRKARIWMNNPLRFAGDTFYQSDYFRDPRTGVETTGLSVVTNIGWMIPYVGCMVVVVALLVQFGIVLVRFSKQLPELSESRPDSKEPPVGPGQSSVTGARRRSSRRAILGWVAPALVVAAAAAWLVAMSRGPKTPEGEMDLAAFGRLPVAYQGRVKPLDTLARNSLRIISDSETFKDREGNRQPAIRWLVDLIADREAGDGHRVFRVREPQLVDALGLEPRRGHRYALEEFRDSLDMLSEQAGKARGKEADERDRYEKKVLELEQKLGLVNLIVLAFAAPEIRTDHAREDIIRVVEYERALQRRHPPLVIPGPEEAATDPHALGNGKQWQTLGMASAVDLVGRFSGREPHRALELIYRILAAYAGDDADDFNRQVVEYQNFLEAHPPHGYDQGTISFEAFFNHAQWFFGAWVLYIVAFVVSCMGFLFWFWGRQIHRTAFWLLVLIFAVHTLALAARVMISGRPPVTNLYSTALFVGWAGALLGLVLQVMFRVGIGNLIASLAGLSTLHIAYQLAGDGDTFKVMQAVLDTNFWLTTHVLTIGLGYAATFVAGHLGLMYLLAGVFTPSLDERLDEVLRKMIYGVLCFALFFSFLGTVLGGLWADDSWGRFWGWDPKENGALIVVLSNALALHAFAARMVRGRGLAVLAVVGNICTGWSWFGVNELNVGLHSYGFTEGALMKLAIFIAVQLACIAVGLLPLTCWWSYRRRHSREAALDRRLA